MGCSKFILFSLNFVVFIVGAAVVGLASTVIHNTNAYTPLLQDGILTLPTIVLIIGLCIGLIGFFGCFGALRENQCMLYTYSVIVICLFIAQLTLGILIFVHQDAAKVTTREAMKKVFEGYDPEKDQSLAHTINSMQTDLECCGVDEYSDWFNILKGNDVTPGCCKKETDIDSCFRDVKSDQSKIYTKGCYYALEAHVMSASYGLGIAAIILAIIQLASIMIACSLGKSAGKMSAYA